HSPSVAVPSKPSSISCVKMSDMRVVSLVPSGTEIAFALGLDEQIVGVSHACRYPAHTKNLPKVTCSVIDLPAGASSAEIDGAYSSQVAAGQPRYQLEEQLLVELQPDILLVQ